MPKEGYPFPSPLSPSFFLFSQFSFFLFPFSFFLFFFFFFFFFFFQVIDFLLQNVRSAEDFCLPSTADRQGRTPLHAAAQSNRHKHSVDTVRALIEAGADIEAEDNQVYVFPFLPFPFLLFFSFLFFSFLFFSFLFFSLLFFAFFFVSLLSFSFYFPGIFTSYVCLLCPSQRTHRRSLLSPSPSPPFFLPPLLSSFFFLLSSFFFLLFFFSLLSSFRLPIFLMS